MVRACCLVILPTKFLCGSPDPFSIPAACLLSTDAGGVFVKNSKERSSKIVSSTGMIVPTWVRVASLYAWTNCMMFTPCCPSAGPTGGAADAWPAGSCSFIFVRTFFAIRALLKLRDLFERQLYRRLPAEQVEQHCHALLVHVDGGHRPAVSVERAADDTHDLALLELELWTRTLLGLRRKNPGDLARIERDRLGPRRSDETGYARRV